MAGSRRVGPHIEILEDNRDQVQAAIKKLASTYVMVGIPSDGESPHYTDTGTPGTVKRQGNDPMNNATLGYIHEHGTAHIPPRPWLGPGMKNSQSEWKPYLYQAGKAAFEGKDTVMNKALHAAGIKAVSAIKKRITDHIAPELADATIAARLRKNPAPAGAVLTAADFTPLVDTSQFYNSIAYVIRFTGKATMGTGNATP